MPGKNPKVPAQENYSDCGVYLLHYAEVWCRTQEDSLPVLSVTSISYIDQYY